MKISHHHHKHHYNQKYKNIFFKALIFQAKLWSLGKEQNLTEQKDTQILNKNK